MFLGYRCTGQYILMFHGSWYIRQYLLMYLGYRCTRRYVIMFLGYRCKLRTNVSCLYTDVHTNAPLVYVSYASYCICVGPTRPLLFHARRSLKTRYLLLLPSHSHTVRLVTSAAWSTSSANFFFTFVTIHTSSWIVVDHIEIVFKSPRAQSPTWYN